MEAGSRILILGKSGQVGSCLAARVPDATALGREDADLSQPLSQILDQIRPDTVINAAAYTAVDKAESEKDLAFRINAEAPGEIARWCAKNQALLIHYSTDYVYSGQGEEPWSENDELSPVNIYGESKLAGEREILNSGCRALILRTSWVYHSQGSNFLRTMLRLAGEHESLKIVGDQMGCPNWAEDLAEATLQMSRNPKSLGVYNLCSEGFTSWFDFATEIFERARQFQELKVHEVTKITSQEYPTPARRPLNSCLNTDKLYRDYAIRLPNWKESTRRCVESYYAGS